MEMLVSCRWGVTGGSFAVTALLSETICARRELRDIPLGLIAFWLIQSLLNPLHLTRQSVQMPMPKHNLLLCLQILPIQHSHTIQLSAVHSGEHHRPKELCRHHCLLYEAKCQP